jgi:hypothetical protein
MQIIIKEPTKESLEKNGWKQWKLTPIYIKKVNKIRVCVRGNECRLPTISVVRPDDLIAIGNELKKLEEN